MKLILNAYLNMDEVLDDSKPYGIIDAGAYLGDWWEVYAKHGVKNRCWIEACKETFDKLVANVPKEDLCLNYAVCDKDENMDFTVTSNWQSSSILSLKNHLVRFPSIIPTKTEIVEGRKFDTLIDAGIIDISKYNFLLMDLQGAEYYALKGFEKNIKHIDYIIAEINYEELYTGCMLVDDFDEYLRGFGFTKVLATHHETVGWGDAYYKRKW